MRFHYALGELTGRRGIRDDVSRYESVALTLVESEGGRAPGGLSPADRRIGLRNFLATLYLRYDERFVYGAPDLKSVTRRRFRTEDSLTLAAGLGGLPYLPSGYAPRVAAPDDGRGRPDP